MKHYIIFALSIFLFGSVCASTRKQRIEKNMASFFHDKDLMSKKITLVTRPSSVGDCISLINASTGLDIIVDPNVKGKCNALCFINRSVGEILDLLCSSNEPRLSLINHRGMWRLMLYNKAYVEAERVWRETYVQKTFALKHVHCDEQFKTKVETMWKTITREISDDHMYCTVDTESKKIFVRAQESYIAELGHFIDEIDCIGQQVKIDAIVAIADKNYEYGLGFNWSGIYDRQASVKGSFEFSKAEVSADSFGMNLMSKGAGLFKLPVTFGGQSMNMPRLALELQAAERDQRVKILLKPSVLASHNETAEILIGKSIPINMLVGTEDKDKDTKHIPTIHYKDIGTILNVRPSVSPDNQTVLLDIWVEDSSASADVSVDKAPVIKTVRTKNKVLLKNGQTTVIGGLMHNRQEDAHVGVPILESLPIIGMFFRGKRVKKEDNELLIFITPTIV